MKTAREWIQGRELQPGVGLVSAKIVQQIQLDAAKRALDIAKAVVRGYTTFDEEVVQNICDELQTAQDNLTELLYENKETQ